MNQKIHLNLNHLYLKYPDVPEEPLVPLEPDVPEDPLPLVPEEPSVPEEPLDPEVPLEVSHLKNPLVPEELVPLCT